MAAKGGQILKYTIGVYSMSVALRPLLENRLPIQGKFTKDIRLGEQEGRFLTVELSGRQALFVLSDILAAAEARGTEVMLLSGESELVVGTMRLELYQPLSGEDENERGFVVSADIRGTEVLVMGDMDAGGELVLVGQGRADTDILIAGHHGSRYSSSSLFLNAASPEWTVVSVGRNRYGHPTEEAMERIYESSENVRRTDTDGTVTIRIR